MGDAVSPVEHFGTISVSAWEPIIHAHSPWRPRRLRPISGIGQLRARRAAAERHAVGGRQERCSSGEAPRGTALRAYYTTPEPDRGRAGVLRTLRARPA